MIPLHDNNPTRILPIVTITLIVICVVVFLFTFSLGASGAERLVYSLGVIPAVFFDHAQLPPSLALIPSELTLVTSMFMHGGWMHLIGNMLYLWIFGNNVEDAMGHGRFIVFYLVCGIAAVLGHALPNTQSEIPMIGASGAISGVLGAYLLLYPYARVLVLIPLGFFFHLVRLPAGWVLAAWFVLQIISSMFSDPGQGGVAWYAHIAGFVAGVALIPLFKHRQVPLLRPFHGSHSISRRIRRP